MHEDAELIDSLNTVRITFMRSRTPGEQPVASENNTLRRQYFLLPVRHQKDAVEPSTLTRKTQQFALKLRVKILEFLAGICAGCKRDTPIRMKMVDMGKRQERVQRSVDR